MATDARIRNRSNLFWLFRQFRNDNDREANPVITFVSWWAVLVARANLVTFAVRANRTVWALVRISSWITNDREAMSVKALVSREALTVSATNLPADAKDTFVSWWALTFRSS